MEQAINVQSLAQKRRTYFKHPGSAQACNPGNTLGPQAQNEHLPRVTVSLKLRSFYLPPFGY